MDWADAPTLDDLAGLLRRLRRREARERGGAELTYRELAAATGWSRSIIGEYLSGRVLPPTDRFDTLVRLLGADASELGALATARDRVEDGRRARPGSVLVPRQLPAEAFGFTGRCGQLAELDAIQGDRSSVVIAVLAGPAGSGKTALALRWAHRTAHRYPDGQLHADLRGSARNPVRPATVLAGFLRSLGVPPERVPSHAAERAALFRTFLARRRVLLMLDDAGSAEQVRPLLPGAASCVVVVASRVDLAPLVARDGARRVAVGALPLTEAVALLHTLVGRRVDDDRAAAVTLAERCRRQPLALRMAAELAVARPSRSLRELLDDPRIPEPPPRVMLEMPRTRLSRRAAAHGRERTCEQAQPAV